MLVPAPVPRSDGIVGSQDNSAAGPGSASKVSLIEFEICRQRARNLPQCLRNVVS